MPNPVDIENIEELRRLAGIDDVELREEIRKLVKGDFVKLTFLTETQACETLQVRITSIKGTAFRGKLADRPATRGLSKLLAGTLLVFTRAHIHSLPKQQFNPED